MSEPASAAPRVVTTIWVGLTPKMLNHLLNDNRAFSAQYESRGRDFRESFVQSDEPGVDIEFVGTELGLCLGIKLFAMHEGLTEFDLPTIILSAEDTKKVFVRNMGRLGISLAKERLEVFAQTQVF